jgi:hypothetical protein
MTFLGVYPAFHEHSHRMNSLRIDLEKPKPPALLAMVNETHFAPTVKNANLYSSL